MSSTPVNNELSWPSEIEEYLFKDELAEYKALVSERLQELHKTGVDLVIFCFEKRQKSDFLFLDVAVYDRDSKEGRQIPHCDLHNFVEALYRKYYKKYYEEYKKTLRSSDVKVTVHLMFSNTEVRDYMVSVSETKNKPIERYPIEE